MSGCFGTCIADEIQAVHKEQNEKRYASDQSFSNVDGDLKRNSIEWHRCATSDSLIATREC